MQQKHIYFFIGTTAELIKVAPIIKEFQKRNIKFKVISAGQTRIRFEDLERYIGPLKADIIFPEKANKSSVFYFVTWALRTFFTSLIILNKEFKGLNKKNSYFIIQGDTVTSSIGAVIATIFRLKLVLVECGDLSFNLLEPFPEEICRNINIRLADILFAPNQWATNNLAHVPGIKINTKYNTLVEIFWWAMKTKRITKKIKSLNKYYLLIMHRQEHVIFRKAWTKKILEFVIQNSDRNLNCLLLGHPLTLQIINNLDRQVKKSKINIIPPIPYPDYMKLMASSEYIASDSAFNQLEAYLMGQPYLSLRDRTEQIEGIGKNVVLCKSDNKVMEEFLSNYKKYRTKPVRTKIRPSKIVVDYLSQHK